MNEKAMETIGTPTEEAIRRHAHRAACHGLGWEPKDLSPILCTFRQDGGFSSITGGP